MGGIALTVTDQGIIGYMCDAGTDGEGMGYQGGGSVLFVGSFWAGTDAQLRLQPRLQRQRRRDLRVAVRRRRPTGASRTSAPTGSDQTFQSVFSDAGHAAPKPLLVEQTSMTFAMPDDDRFVILEYRMTNHGATALPTCTPASSATSTSPIRAPTSAPPTRRGS